MKLIPVLGCTRGMRCQLSKSRAVISCTSCARSAALTIHTPPPACKKIGLSSALFSFFNHVHTVDVASCHDECPHQFVLMVPWCLGFGSPSNLCFWQHSICKGVSSTHGTCRCLCTPPAPQNPCQWKSCIDTLALVTLLTSAIRD